MSRADRLLESVEVGELFFKSGDQEISVKNLTDALSKLNDLRKRESGMAQTIWLFRKKKNDQVDHITRVHLDSRKGVYVKG